MASFQTKNHLVLGSWTSHLEKQAFLYETCPSIISTHSTPHFTHTCKVKFKPKFFVPKSLDTMHSLLSLLSLFPMEHWAKPKNKSGQLLWRDTHTHTYTQLKSQDMMSNFQWTFERESQAPYTDWHTWSFSKLSFWVG
jgi:hypothetical protein